MVSCTSNFLVATFFILVFEDWQSVYAMNDSSAQTQSISFPPLSQQNYYTPNGWVPLAATASSGLPVSYTVYSESTDEYVIDDNNNRLYYFRPGEFSITASQSGDGTNWLAATQVTHNYRVLPGKQTVSLWVPRFVGYDPYTPVMLYASSSSGELVTFSGYGNIFGNVGYAYFYSLGEYVITATAGDGGGLWAPASATITLTVVPNWVYLFMLDTYETTYDGSPKEVWVDVDGGVYRPNISVTYNGSTTVPTNPGTYTVEAIVTDPNYMSQPRTAVLVIAKAAATVSVSNTDQTYNGTAQGVAVTTTPGGLTSSVVYTGANYGPATNMPPTNAGIYEVEVSVADQNYTGSDIATLTIAKASNAVSNFTPISTQTFSSNATVSISVPASSSGLPANLSVVSGPATINGNTLTLTGPGTVVLAADQVGDSNYMPASRVTTSFTVSAAVAPVKVPVIYMEGSTVIRKKEEVGQR